MILNFLVIIADGKRKRPKKNCETEYLLQLQALMNVPVSGSVWTGSMWMVTPRCPFCS